MNTPQKTNMIEFLSEMAGRNVWYSPNPGNAGDSAIALATFEAFKKVGERYRTMAWNDPTPREREVVIYGGGGNLTGYPQARRFVERHLSLAGRLIILPHTIRGNEDSLGQLRPNDDVFCRELRSYEWVRSVTDQPSVHLADDMAFELDVDSIVDSELFRGLNAVDCATRCLFISALNRVSINRSTRIGAFPVRKAVARFSDVIRVLSGRKEMLNVMRTDRESLGVAPPSPNLDLSTTFDYGVDHPEVTFRATRAVLSVLNCFERVATNRLHIAILSGLLGKDVDFYANNYFKNEAVYEFSMRDRFPHVQWRGRRTAEQPESS